MEYEVRQTAGSFAVAIKRAVENIRKRYFKGKRIKELTIKAIKL